MYGLDVAVTRAINGLAGHSAAIDYLMVWISGIGVPVMVMAVALQWWRGSDRPHIRHVIVAAGFSFLLGLGLNQLILLFIHRARPYDSGVTNLLIERSADFSFPSDHATATFAIAAAFLLHGARRSGFAFLAAACFVTFSRIYIGTHYASDVFGGALTGVIAALMVLAIYREGTKADRLITRIF
ncbi:MULTISPECIES: phosphatase PAP2 family protein [unclassified Rhizobium]|uniref:phosphatase PAP2 family protein n=1 Tax=unclassified Rhizobium TaxID=2613769 RepID=UPI001A9901DF|nr:MULTISPECIES: phosphatase PAP2 family protein [unclassified Rhizobium]MBX5160628.1 phosphatase PAP2 family protein [Rhizobium sp. NZLR8]MBX5174520.1 phosphatase PAP2 family protein [Rhizobium sp. NZLR1b]MBX5185485.1 phosphatase PAP2 family protein [Rhizobium sp. NZLR5]MBX5193605.1 phosphatase PAP2 family protein [Rhizobium sp. NZLR3b]MBX5198552.1 phosphatase PAP2 family protein [Rhizobium sp. NZLR10]